MEIRDKKTLKTQLFCAPLQGYTDVVWREAHNAIFGGVDCYYGSLLRLERGELRRHDRRDIDPQANASLPRFVPQLLGDAADAAVAIAVALRDMGYTEVDINLGCPHPPLALHHKGSGLLPYPEELRRMAEALAAVDGLRYSVKMRLGWDDDSQWRDALPALDPLHPVHVTVHPRIGRQGYRGELSLGQMEALIDACPWPVIYNGELHTLDNIVNVIERFPAIAGVMVGRALVADPALLVPERATARHYRDFHDRLFEGYRSRLTGGDHQLLSKMQSLWQYFLPNSPRRALKAIAKARTLDAYLAAATQCLKI